MGEGMGREELARELQEWEDSLPLVAPEVPQKVREHLQDIASLLEDTSLTPAYAEDTAKRCFKLESQLVAGWHSPGASEPTPEKRELVRVLGRAGEEMRKVGELLGSDVNQTD